MISPIRFSSAVAPSPCLEREAEKKLRESRYSESQYSSGMSVDELWFGRGFRLRNAEFSEALGDSLANLPPKNEGRRGACRTALVRPKFEHAGLEVKLAC